MAEEKTAENAPEQQAKNTSILPIVTIGLLVITMSIASAGVYFTIARCSNSAAATAAIEDQEEDDATTEQPTIKEAYYFSLDPAFIVNFNSKNQKGFLQINIDGLTRDASVKEEITRHLPQIRNSIVLLLSRQKYSDLILQEGKENLRKEILVAIQSILKNETGEEGIEDIYFTNFVMQ